MQLGLCPRRLRVSPGIFVTKGNGDVVELGGWCSNLADMSDVTLLWFKRDFRVVDHAALARACALGPVVPLYVWEPKLWAQPDASGLQFGFVRESVAELRTSLAALGLELCERIGDANEVLAQVQRVSGFVRMISPEETGNGWSFSRDRAVAQWARGAGVLWEDVAGCGVVRRLNGRDGWVRLRDAYVRAPVVGGAKGSGLVLASSAPQVCG